MGSGKDSVVLCVGGRGGAVRVRGLVVVCVSGGNVALSRDVVCCGCCYLGTVQLILRVFEL